MLRPDQTAEARTRHSDGVETALRAPRAWTGGPGCLIANDLVGRLSSQSRHQLLDRCETVRLFQRQMLQERGAELRFAYFIESGAASLTARAGDCPPVEIHTLGRKDFVGIPLILGMRVSPHRCTVQVAGQALRLPAEDLVHLVKTNVEIEKLLLGYVQATLIHSSQLIACNSRHNLTQRLARWLLVAKDRFGSNEIALTHRAMAQALAVRRAGITTTMGAMEHAGMIRRGRGRTVIVDERRLEAVSCNCYHVIQSAHDRSLNLPPAIRIAHS
ncbi:CRP-like cAMP-binding protein [Bradyrhizobium sp. AZCC 1610]|uniref:Crp/Fnr family transcriptional regulator n=1 Tax=Bradyrhizobium sp. AZCC 1610 TaxID=3117020 RepID=UPI002FF01CB0